MQKQFARNLFWKLTLFTLTLLICLATPGLAMDVTLEWDANSETDLVGYRIYYDTGSGPPYEGTGAAGGDSPIDVKATDVEVGATANYTVAGLDENETYFFVVTAYNASGSESRYSREVSTADDPSTGTSNASSGNDSSGCFITTTAY